MNTKVHVYFAVKRNKDNKPEHHGHSSVREICSDNEPQTIRRLKASITEPGIWRIYRSVNSRDVKKAELELVKTLIDRMALPLSTSPLPLISLWKTILMQPHNKAEKKFLIDIDSEDALTPVLSNPVIEIERQVRTPNGYHLVCKPFDVRILEGIQNASIQKDGLLFIDRFEVKGV
jgi:hypothetical protein